MFKVGDKVRCPNYGEGYVKNAKANKWGKTYPIEVIFFRHNGNSIHFTKDGKRMEDSQNENDKIYLITPLEQLL